MTESDPLPRRTVRGRPAIIAAALGLLVAGGGAGALAVNATRPSVTMAPAAPVAIRTLADDSLVTIRGTVAEIYGNKFILADSSGRALIETGRGGDGTALVAVGQPVTVQGRFDRGVVHAAFLVGPDRKIVALGPMGGPHDRHGPRRGPGDRDRAGPDDDRDAPPPAPPAPASGT